MTRLSRRRFCASSLLAPLAFAADDPGWFGKPMRWAQLTLVENDPGNYDPKFWLDYFRRTHSDAACLSAGGCVAYYPTKLPYHHRSRWLNGSDPFGELYEGCRQQGMVVIARTDPHATYDDVATAHPDWIAVDGEGKPRRHWASPELWVTCALGPYNFEFMTGVTREIVERYPVDGIFSNRWDGSGMCYCGHCRNNFHAASGLDLPRTNDPQNPARREYILWRQARLFELWRLWDAEIRKIRPGARFIANAGGGALSSLDMKTIGELVPTLFADRQARRGVMLPWANGKNGKEYRSTLGRKAIVGIFSVGVEEPYRWKDSVQSEAEIRIWVADGAANGLRPWFTKFSGTLYDRRWLKVVEDIYDWHWRNERYLRNEEPVAEVGLVYSQQSAWFYGGEHAREKVEDAALGFYQALVEARIPFEMVHDRLLDQAKYRVLILPNIAALSDTQCAQLREFVRRGGSLVASYETSLYDEFGKRRADFGIGDLFGAAYGGRTEGPMQNSYLHLESETKHPLLAGFSDTTRIINAVRRVVAVRRPGWNGVAPLSLIPSYPDLPMEMVYPRTGPSGIPGVFASDKVLGGGRVVYFPQDLDRTFWEVLSPDHGALLKNAVAWASGSPAPVIVTGHGLLDVTVWRQKSSMTVHLVNLSNPMAMKGPYREVVPVGEQHVSLRLPEGARPKSMKFLVSGGSPTYRTRAGRLEVTVPSIGVHEVIAVDL